MLQGPGYPGPLCKFAALFTKMLRITVVYRASNYLKRKCINVIEEKQKDMKRLIKLVFLIGIVATVSVLASCNSPWFDPVEKSKGRAEEVPGVIKDCDLTGTMIRVSCATSIYNNLWIRTDNGKLIRPCQQSFRPICPVVLKEGDRVKFSYRNLSDGSSCADTYGCAVVPPIHQKAVIDCITLENGRNPEDTIPQNITKGVAKDETGVTLLDAAVHDNVLSLTIAYSGCAEFENQDFKLVWDGRISEDNPGVATLQIVQQKKDLCNTTFKKRLKYNLKDLHEKHSGKILLVLKDKRIAL